MIKHIMNQIFNHIYRILVALAITPLIAGCSDNAIVSNELISDAPGTITLRFKNTEMSRSTDSDNSEIRINNLVIGLYPTGFDESSAPVFWDIYENINKSSTATVTLKLTKGMIHDLFRDDDGAKCRIFALANVPDLTQLPTPSTIKQMKSLAVESPFYDTMVQESFIMYGDSEVKYNKEPESLDALGKATGNIDLIRAASKIILNLNLPTIEIKDENGNVVETWESVEDVSQIKATLNNGVKKSIACPLTGEDNQPWKPTGTDAYYSGNLSVDGSFRKFVDNSSNQNYPYTMEVPFYTYPNSWSETLNETHKTTITLCVPWKRGGEEAYQTFYYQVPVTKSDITFISNNHSYIINLKVGMLGSREPDQPELLTDMSYNIVDWGNEGLEVNIDDIRYLVVNPTEYVVNNEEEISIPFYTSHPVEISDYSITYPQFNVYTRTATEKIGLPVDIIMKKEVIDKSVYTPDPNKDVTDTIATFNIAQDPQTNQMILKVNHELVMWTPMNSSGNEVKLVGRISSNTGTIENINNSIVRYERPANDNLFNAYYPYTIKVTIRHKDAGYRDTYKETVTITQYPGMYVTVDRNPGGPYYTYTGTNARPWTQPGNRGEGKHGYAFVNPYEEEYNNHICWVNDYSLGGLKVFEPTATNITLINPCMYIIHVTQFDPSMSDQYVIGNPRSKLINNMNYTDLSDEDLEKDLDIQDATPADKWNPIHLGTNSSINDDVIEGWCHEADALYTNNSSNKRTLEYYYPTIESDETKDMVAPLYRFASAYGALRDWSQLKSPNTRKLGRRRIATYQERQFASGRWRLPTYGEFRLIVWLSTTNRIPTLFNDGQLYLTAHGIYAVNTKTGELVESLAPSGCNARGVYDDWYWNEEKEYVLQSEEDGSFRYTFGDMPQKTIQSNN